MQKNHYQTLGLKDGATREEVEASHDKALRRFILSHKEGRPLPRDDFDVMEEAYAALGDPERKVRMTGNFFTRSGYPLHGRVSDKACKRITTRPSA
ncbi:MAG: hypothetical protein LBJ76_02970 [Candidatus Accumulibacter sp.]|jgi:hypothetical protein|nr:hypothetical protein [Accumulibacter sp.]